MHESVHILHDTPANLQVSYAIRSFMNELRNIFGPLEFVEMDGGDTVLYQIKQLPGMRSKEKDYDLSFFFYPSGDNVVTSNYLIDKGEVLTTSKRNSVHATMKRLLNTLTSPFHKSNIKIMHDKTFTDFFIVHMRDVQPLFRLTKHEPIA